MLLSQCFCGDLRAVVRASPGEPAAAVAPQEAVPESPASRGAGCDSRRTTFNIDLHIPASFVIGANQNCQLYQEKLVRRKFENRPCRPPEGTFAEGLCTLVGFRNPTDVHTRNVTRRLSAEWQTKPHSQNFSSFIFDIYPLHLHQNHEQRVRQYKFSQELYRVLRLQQHMSQTLHRNAGGPARV